MSITTRRVRVRGHGRAEVAAYGVADAEHQTERELLRAWPEARVIVQEVRRREEAGRIVETFSVGFRVEGWVDGEGSDAAAAERHAFRQVRERLKGTRFRGVRLETVEAEKANFR